MKLSGRVAFRDIETGVWVLEGDDGCTYQLAGGDRKIKKEGQRVEVDGKVDNDSVTLHMVGPIFNVASYKFL
ncbi:DUF5818 domain-containing protein [Hyalangium versicolor]|uniref:DUF5818 domain-containing protein n=1 Tax=Hyalangium versicolor TaxID=2861190 RepID=UPI001CCAAE03|nr:DUF5818 domain-containing protein [Hyalangium versicolor]